jgi:hypothetical protein
MVTKRWMGTCVMSIAIGAISVAGSDAQSAKAADKPDGAKQTLTLTGCLQGPIAGDEYAQSGARPARVSEANATYRLTNVTVKPAPAGAVTYLVVGNERQLSAQLGHQVEIVGPVVTPQPRGTTGGTPAPPTADEYYESTAGKPAQAARVTAGEPTVRVESVRMVSAKCSPRR